jgi:hypothetical protein
MNSGRKNYDRKSVTDSYDRGTLHHLEQMAVYGAKEGLTIQINVRPFDNASSVQPGDTPNVAVLILTHSAKKEKSVVSPTNIASLELHAPLRSPLSQVKRP